MTPLLTVDGLDVSFGALRAVRDVSFTLDAGECLAVVGESGSGKSVTARALVGLAGDGSRVRAGTLEFDGHDLTRLREPQWRGLRGRRVGLVLQDALSSLDPLRTVGAEIAEPLRVHGVEPRSRRADRVRDLLADVGVPQPQLRAAQYPHQLSGGLRQRALIASAIAAGPDLLIADEPTTALDVSVQAQILDLLDRLRREGTALLLISHDLSVVARLADRVAVMYGGRIVETGPGRRVLERPRHPYTRALLDAVPALHAKGARLSAPTVPRPHAGRDGCPYAHRCAAADEACRTALPAVTGPDAAVCHHPLDGEESDRTPQKPHATARVAVRDREPHVEAGTGGSPAAPPLLEVDAVSKGFRGPDGAVHHAVREVSLRLAAGEAVGVVGESGSGKTTVARIALGLVPPDAGQVRFEGRPWSGVPERQRRTARPRIQAVQQDPLGSFDPRYSVERVVGEAVARAGVRGRAERLARAAELLDRVGLPAAVLGRRPGELSGGQRQRVALARALATSPGVVVCDEPVSALDVSVQAQILDLLADIRRDTGVALLFISHDLAVVRHVSDRIAVMKDGRVVESGPVREVFDAPSHAYTRALLSAASPLPAPPPAPLHRTGPA
ncbi:peptide/nickel transport system ATP-binding protein [Actinacidiphila yanglinensis]|uniref:Peptide/nickel transport system ATP-binding protein n=1 Tax=Actinacidiphila yanglinensis TaxID=310779 RepID=A0A1H6DQE3_9ACTN|nr:ABC transporter ATP-binding protein [Actinacidiphila yanglinensis]SEG87509.1 peptide/nickel transport system ATP-binding protein [Actinacidiphila yanglinensis]